MAGGSLGDGHNEELGELSMGCFKSRLASGRQFGMKFEKGLRFVSCDNFKSAGTVTQIIKKILEINPCINQTAITELGRAQGCSKRQIENCLKTGEWVRSRGPKNSTLYSVPDGGSDGQMKPPVEQGQILFPSFLFLRDGKLAAID
jgi:hypothetical protein